jgi:hypothetical protein
MPLPSLTKAASARPQKATSIADLLARQAAKTQSPRAPDSVSLPFGGVSPEQLAHEAQVASFRVPPRTQLPAIAAAPSEPTQY